MTGVIYLRDNKWYKNENVIKMGITSSAKDRSNNYITGEVERGEYILVIEIPIEKLIQADKWLKDYFKKYHIDKGGGTEFYDRLIIDLVEPFIKSLEIEYKILSKYEIELLTRRDRIRQLINRLNFKNNRFKLEPNYQQHYILENIEQFYEKYNKGKLIWACGLGKALLSILIIKLLKFKRVIFGVPSNNLQTQIRKEILKIFPNNENILLVGSEGTNSTTDKEKIKLFLENTDNNKTKFIVATYHSCYLLVDPEIIFDFKCGDEAHHIVGTETEEEKGFRLFHKILARKSLFMTATEKTIQNEKYSMDNKSIFGEYIDIKTVHWAIENKKITDYNILVLKNTEEEVEDIIQKLKVDVANRELFISCFMCLKSFEKYSDLTHILLYTNSTKDAELATKYINDIIILNILNIREDFLYNKALHSKNCNNLKGEIEEFKNQRYGIISCVYIFGEGFDLPKLNGVCIAGNMQSETRIVQYLLRPNRLEIDNPNKKSYVVIPYIDNDDWDNEEKSYEKIRNIISHMRNVDENIEQKIIILARDNQNIQRNRQVAAGAAIGRNFNFEENQNDLDKIKMRLRYSKALGSDFSEEQDEYNYVRAINISLNVKSKKEYYNTRNKHSNFITSPEEYFKAKGVWIGWYNFLGCDTSGYLEDKIKWKKFCREKKIKTLEDYYENCEIYDVLPKEPADFYREFSNILSELSYNSSRRQELTAKPLDP